MKRQWKPISVTHPQYSAPPIAPMAPVTLLCPSPLTLLCPSPPTLLYPSPPTLLCPSTPTLLCLVPPTSRVLYQSPSYVPHHPSVACNRQPPMFCTSMNHPNTHQCWNAPTVFIVCISSLHWSPSCPLDGGNNEHGLKTLRANNSLTIK